MKTYKVRPRIKMKLTVDAKSRREAEAIATRAVERIIRVGSEELGLGDKLDVVDR